MIKIILISVIVAYALGVIWAIRTERKNWNGGVCPKCGKELKHTNTDAHGCELWECPECGHSVCVSYLKFVYKTRRKK